jgi:hypothetical protein
MYLCKSLNILTLFSGSNAALAAFLDAHRSLNLFNNMLKNETIEFALSAKQRQFNELDKGLRFIG